MSMTEKKTEKLKWVPCIWYFVTFKNLIKALLDSESEVNIISQVFASLLGLKIQKTNIGAQKINNTILEAYKIVVFKFFVLEKDGRERFFEESFLLANVKLHIVLKIPFPTMSNTDIDFQARNL